MREDAPTPPSGDVEPTTPVNDNLAKHNIGSSAPVRSLMRPVNEKEAGSEEDENKERGNWSNDLQFILACMGYAIGLGNVWRYPYLVYRHGGGFIVAYWLLLFLVAYPIFAMELYFGQFFSRGPVHLFREFLPAFEGLGFACLFVQVLVCIYYNSIHAYAIFYTFSSIGSPWARCDSPHNSPVCFSLRDYDQCIQGSPDINFYAKKSCYDGAFQVSEFLRRLEDDCLRDVNRYGESAGVGDWECNVKLSFLFNATLSLPRLFALKDNFDFDSFLNSTHSKCGDVLFSRWDTCSFTMQPVIIQSRKEFQEWSKETLLIDLNRKSLDWKTATERAKCLVKLLDAGTHTRWMIPSYLQAGDGEIDEKDLNITDVKSLLDVDFVNAMELSRAKAKDNWRTIPKLSSLLAGYCKAVFVGENGMVTKADLPTAKCVRRVVSFKYFSSEEFLNRYALKEADLSGVGEAGISYQMILCLLLAWALTAIGVYKGPKWTGQIVYVTAGFPFIMIGLLIIISVFLPGASDGVAYYMLFDVCRLGKIQLWVDALSQIFFSLGVGCGGLMTLSSYNKFHNDVVRDSIIVMLSNCLFSFFGGFGVFGLIGYMAHLVNTTVPLVVRGSGPGLAFVVIAQATTGMAGGEIFAFFFYFMLILLAIDSQFAGMEMILTFIYDEFPATKRFRFLVTTTMSCVFCAVGLPFASNAGLNANDFIDAGLYNVVIPFTVLITLLANTFLYGNLRSIQDLQMMIGINSKTHKNPIGSFFANTVARFYWVVTWSFSAPLGVGAIIVFNWLGWKENLGKNALNDMKFFVCGVGPLVLLFVCPPIYSLLYRRTRLCDLFKPSATWGPALNIHRTGRYHPIPERQIKEADDDQLDSKLQVKAASAV